MTAVAIDDVPFGGAVYMRGAEGFLTAMRAAALTAGGTVALKAALVALAAAEH